MGELNCLQFKCNIIFDQAVLYQSWIASLFIARMHKSMEIDYLVSKFNLLLICQQKLADRRYIHSTGLTNFTELTHLHV